MASSARFGLGGTAFGLKIGDDGPSDALLASHRVGRRQGVYTDKQLDSVRRVEVPVGELWPGTEKRILDDRPDLADESSMAIFMREVRRASLTPEEARLLAATYGSKGRRRTRRELATMFGCSHTTIGRRLAVVKGKVSACLEEWEDTPRQDRDPIISMLIEVFRLWMVRWTYWWV